MDANDENPNGDADDAALTPGTSFGAYTISRRIGKGGMGSVYESTHSALGKRVAVKVLHPAVSSRAQVRTRFLREAQAVSRLRHPHVVDASDFGVHEGVPFLVMELLDGETLAQRLAREGALSPELAAATLLPVCSAIAAAHAEGIIHRDLKPGNIFLARTRLGAEVPKVLDFGISKFIDERSPQGDLTNSSALLGTVWYMSPEQALDARAVTPASDQYALGVILYECVTGQRAFHGESFFVAMRAITDGAFVPPRSLRPTLSTELESVILRAMRRAPSERFASVEAFARALLPFATPATRASWEPVFTADPPPPTEVSERPAVSAHAATEASSWERPEPSLDSPPEPAAPAAGAISAAFAPTAPATPRTSRRVVASLIALGVVLALGLFASSRPRTPPTPVAPRPSAPPPASRAAPPAPSPVVATPVLAAVTIPAPVTVDAGAVPHETPRVRPAPVRHPARTQAAPRVARPTSERLLGTNGAPIED